jgi:DNA polymerase III delta subunit
MVYYLYGSDSYRRSEKLREILNAYRAKHKYADMRVFDLDHNPDEWRDASYFAGQPSMFEDAKVLVVYESGSATEEKPWKEFLKNVCARKDVFLFISDTKKPKTAFSFLLKDAEKVQEFNELVGRELSSFVKKEAEKRRVAFSPDAFNIFIQNIESSIEPSWRAISELEIFSLLGVSKISISDLRTYSNMSKRREVFAEARAIISANGIGKKLEALERLLLQNEAPAYIFNSIGFQSKGPDAEKLAGYDVSVKSGKLEYEEALLDFVLSS